MKWTTTREAAVLHGVKILVYAKAGYGKTVLCSTAPRPCIISAEAGLLSVRHLDIPVIEIDTLNDLSDACDYFESNPRQAREAIDTVCLDSVTEIAEKVLANAKKVVKDPRQAYGEMIEKVTEVIKRFRDLKGFHVVFTAKQEYDKEEGSSVMINKPMMPGNKMGQNLPYLFDEVFRLGIGKTDTGVAYRFLQTQPDFQYDAKDRSGALDVLEEPDLTKVIAKILSTTQHG